MKVANAPNHVRFGVFLSIIQQVIGCQVIGCLHLSKNAKDPSLASLAATNDKAERTICSPISPQVSTIEIRPFILLSLSQITKVCQADSKLVRPIHLNNEYTNVGA